MTAVIYARYSSDNQREESIEGQIRECTAYAEKNGITIVKHYIDRAISAKTDNRPEFQQMIKDSDKKLFDIVLVWKLDRLVADSRQVALNHTAGLSLPQQTQMSLFASFAILDKENRYKNKMQEIIRRRLKALWDNTGFSLVDDPLRVGYYSEIDMLVWAKIFYGEEFVSYLKKTYSPLDVVFRLANETSLVLLNGGGFAGPEWSVRVSLANLNEKDYVKIGQGIKRILDEYAVKWQESRK